MKLVGVAAIVLITAPAARAGWIEGWKPPNKYEVVIHVAASSLIILDTWQSFDIKNHKQYVETNPLLFSEHPSDAAIIGAGLLSLAVTTSIWYALPPQIRWVTDIAIVYVEGPVVYRNFTKWGLRLIVPF